MAPFLPQVDPRVSMHAYGVSYDPNNGDGSAVGYNDDTTVGVGETITYFWRAPASEGLYLFRDMGMPAGGDHDGGGSEHGLYGGLAVEPAGSHWFDPTSGAELSSTTPNQQYASVAGQSGDLYIQSAIAVSDGRRFRESVEISQGVIPVVIAEGAEAPHPADPAIEGPEAEGPELEAPKVAVVEAPERFGFNFGSEAEYKRLEYRDKWCADCVGEETGLSSWVYGDPSTVKLAGGSGPVVAGPARLPGTRPARPSGRSARRAWWHPGTERRGLRPAPDERARRDASRVVLHGERDTSLPGRPAQDPFRTCGHLRDPRVPPARPHLVGGTGRQRPRRIDPAAADAVGPAAGDHDRLADLQPLDGVHRRHQLRRRSTCRHRRRRDLPLPSLPPLRRRFLGAPARARRRGERHRRDP